MTTAPSTDVSAPTAFRHAAAMLSVADVARSAEHYRDKLGFTIVGVWPDVPYAVVNRGGVEIHFRRKAEAHAPGGVYIYVANADAVHAELTARGVQPIGEPHDQFYGLRDFGVRDPDGHLLMFSSPTAK
jgi:uncharacterized glyoxalase superfamily protein PhnB